MIFIILLVYYIFADGSPLHETHREGYTCVARSVLGFVYLPNTCEDINFHIQSVSDVTLHPKTTANEVVMTPVVLITPLSKNLCCDKPVLIELMKSTELFEHSGDIQIFPLSSSTDKFVPPNWKKLCEECDVLEDRIGFKTTHFSYFVVIAQFSPPTTNARVDPNVSNPRSQVQLTVSELPGFKVQIPAKSVESATEIKATLYCDDPEVCKENVKQPLASACVQFEPHGQRFTVKIPVQIPIPSYAEIIRKNPDAKLQLWYTPGSVTATKGSSLNWIMDNDTELEISSDAEVGHVATFYTDHFSSCKITWSQRVAGAAEAIGNIFKHVKSLAGRCQVFMTRETEIPGSVINFSIQVLVHPFQDSPHEIPKNYHHILYDSGSNPIEFTPGKLCFFMKLKRYLFSQPVSSDQQVYSKTRQLSEKFPAMVEFDIDLDKHTLISELKEGAVLAHLSIGHKDVKEHEFNLIKVYSACWSKMYTALATKMLKSASSTL